jgi:hypothetical protein
VTVMFVYELTILQEGREGKDGGREKCHIYIIHVMVLHEVSEEFPLSSKNAPFPYLDPFGTSHQLIRKFFEAEA